MKDMTLELLSADNLHEARAIRREDVSEAYVDTVDEIMELTQYGLDHHCLGHTYAVRYGGELIGVILLGEAIPWESDPAEMGEEPFYRLMGFLMDRRFRGLGLGGRVLEEAVRRVYREFGVRPIALGCHKDNVGAQRFWLRHGFCKTDSMEGDDYYYLRYPCSP